MLHGLVHDSRERIFKTGSTDLPIASYLFIKRSLTPTTSQHLKISYFHRINRVPNVAPQNVRLRYPLGGFAIAVRLMQ